MRLPFCTLAKDASRGNNILLLRIFLTDNIKSVRIAAEKLADAAGISTADAGKLVAAGFVTVDGLKAADLDAVAAIEGLNFGEVSAAIARLKD